MDEKDRNKCSEDLEKAYRRNMLQGLEALGEHVAEDLDEYTPWSCEWIEQAKKFIQIYEQAKKIEGETIE